MVDVNIVKLTFLYDDHADVALSNLSSLEVHICSLCTCWQSAHLQSAHLSAVFSAMS